MSEGAMLHSINGKLSELRERRLLTMSPRTRAAHDEFLLCQREDEEAGYQWWSDPEHPSYADAYTSEDDGEEDETAALHPPDWRKREVGGERGEEPALAAGSRMKGGIS